MGDRKWVSSGSPFEEPVGYSRATRTGDRVLVSGTAPVWPDGTCPDDAGLQARRCFEIIEAALSQLGASLPDIVRTRVSSRQWTMLTRWGQCTGSSFVGLVR